MGVMDYREIEPRMKAALFDMDGTLIDSMPFWRQCNLEFMKMLGYEVPPEKQKHVLQSSGGMLAQFAREEYGVEVDPDALLELQKKRMHDAYSRGVAIKPGVVEYLEYLKKRGVLRVVATATWTPYTELALERCGLRRHVDVLCCADFIGYSKRQAAYFDKVAEVIGHPKSACVLFEDAAYALRGGREANILGEVAVADVLNEAFRDELRSLADVFVDSLAELIGLTNAP